MVSRLKGSLTFLAARMNFCLGVSGSGVEELRKRVKTGIFGWQLMTLSAGLEESGWHSGRLPGMLWRLASGTGILPGEDELTGGNPGGLADFCPCPMAPSADRSAGAGLPTGGSCMARSGEGWGASGRPSDRIGGEVGCWAEKTGRPRKRVASRRTPLRTLRVMDRWRPRPTFRMPDRPSQVKNRHRRSPGTAKKNSYQRRCALLIRGRGACQRWETCAPQWERIPIPGFLQRRWRWMSGK
jgi:hypothetical protein